MEGSFLMLSGSLVFVIGNFLTSFLSTPRPKTHFVELSTFSVPISSSSSELSLSEIPLQSMVSSRPKESKTVSIEVNIEDSCNTLELPSKRHRSTDFDELYEDFKQKNVIKRESQQDDLRRILGIRRKPIKKIIPMHGLMSPVPLFRSINKK